MPGLSAAELGILQGIQNILQCGFLDTVMPVISSFADDGLLWIAMALAFLLIRGQRSTGAQMILALVLSVILCNLWLKHMIDRPRPFEVDPRLDVPGFSGQHREAEFERFPCGHPVLARRRGDVLTLSHGQNWSNPFASIASISSRPPLFTMRPALSTWTASGCTYSSSFW